MSLNNSKKENLKYKQQINFWCQRPTHSIQLQVKLLYIQYIGHLFAKAQISYILQK